MSKPLSKYICNNYGSSKTPPPPTQLSTLWGAAYQFCVISLAIKIPFTFIDKITNACLSELGQNNLWTEIVNTGE